MTVKREGAYNPWSTMSAQGAPSVCPWGGCSLFRPSWEGLASVALGTSPLSIRSLTELSHKEQPNRTSSLGILERTHRRLHTFPPGPAQAC